MNKRLAYAILDGLGFGALNIVAMIYLFSQPTNNATLLKGALAALLLIILETTVVKVRRG